jgi:glycosyltransferase involved in cell wall biosynthesis
VKFCTVIACNYLAHARVLAASLRRFEPEASLAVLVLDDVDEVIGEGIEEFDVLRPADLDISALEFHRMATIYGVLELATAVKPWLLQHLLERDEVVCYLDPDIEVFASMSEVEELALRHSIVLTPHTTSPMPRDGLIPGEREIRLAGVFNLGFIAVSRDAFSFLSWWAERLRRECRISVHEGLFVDQRWIDFVPGYFEHEVLVDPGYNVAYWNLYDRVVKRGRDGYEVNGVPLRFVHYSGFDPLRPHVLSKHQVGEPRVRLDERPPLARLCHRYATQLMNAGYLAAIGRAYRYDYTIQGMPIDARMRRLYADALVDADKGDTPSHLPNPFDGGEAPAFARWFNAPAAGNGAERIPRYLRAVYDERRDLVDHFGDISGDGGDRFMDWMRKHGSTQAGIPVACAPTPARLGVRDPTLPWGVNLVGYVRAEDGVGTVARSLFDVLRQIDSPVAVRTCAATSSRQSASFPENDSATTYDLTIACVNADQFPLLHDHLGPHLPLGTRMVGVWAWEVEAFPEWMARSARLVDEVWVYSKHAANALAPMVDVPIHTFAPPVPVRDSDPEIDREALGLSDDFLFLFCFDFLSGFERKNPLAVIEAFCRAFAPGEGPRLLVKSVNGDRAPAAMARLRSAAGNRSDVVTRDGHESELRQQALISGCDCYVSLHRAEGYGLTLAEAMAAGRPVIATAYSGNLDFMTEETAFLVPYEYVQIPYGCDPYPPRTPWAEPDIDAAASAMRQVVSDPALGRAVGSRAREHIRNNHGVGARTEFVRERLDAIRGGN